MREFAQIQEAIFGHDTATLIAAGRKSAQIRREKKARELRIKNAQIAREMLERAIECNEHILTPDGEDGVFPDGVIRY